MYASAGENPCHGGALCDASGCRLLNDDGILLKVTFSTNTSKLYSIIGAFCMRLMHSAQAEAFIIILIFSVFVIVSHN